MASDAQVDATARKLVLQITSSVSLLASTVALRRPLLATISCDSSSKIYGVHFIVSLLRFQSGPSFGL